MKILFLDIDGVINTSRWDVYKSFSKWECFKQWFGGKVWKIVCFLNLQNWYQSHFCAWHSGRFDPYAIFYLNRMLDQIPHLHIVISSVWRFLGLTELKRLFKEMGVDPDRIISCTPSEDYNGYRGSEIKAWLHGTHGNPRRPAKDRNEWRKNNPNNVEHTMYKSVDSFVILDDDNDMFPYADRLVRTNAYDGLGDKEYRQILTMFLGGNND